MGLGFRVSHTQHPVPRPPKQHPARQRTSLGGACRRTTGPARAPKQRRVLPCPGFRVVRSQVKGNSLLFFLFYFLEGRCIVNPLATFAPEMPPASLGRVTSGAGLQEQQGPVTTLLSAPLVINIRDENGTVIDIGPCVLKAARCIRGPPFGPTPSQKSPRPTVRPAENSDDGSAGGPHTPGWGRAPKQKAVNRAVFRNLKPFSTAYRLPK